MSEEIKPIEPIKEKLDEKIKALNSSRVFKKVTPLHDKSWYIKWASSIVLIMCIISASANFHPWNLYLGLVGVSGWLVVGMLWHDRALITLNAVSVAIYASGIANYWLGN
jgi:hypothetical protein